jgi:hypothetical protein
LTTRLPVESTQDRKIPDKVPGTALGSVIYDTNSVILFTSWTAAGFATGFCRAKVSKSSNLIVTKNDNEMGDPRGSISEAIDAHAAHTCEHILRRTPVDKNNVNPSPEGPILEDLLCSAHWQIHGHRPGYVEEIALPTRRRNKGNLNP